MSVDTGVQAAGGIGNVRGVSPAEFIRVLNDRVLNDAGWRGQQPGSLG